MFVQYKNLSLRKQLWVWAAVCIAPALTIGLILYAHISANHRSSEREMMGLRYARVVWDVVAMVTDVVHEGNQADRARVLDGRLQAAHADYGGKIEAEASRQRFLEKMEPLGWPQLDVVAKTNAAPAAAATRAFLREIAEVSNLTLDPDLPPSYLVELTTIRLPLVRERLSRFRNGASAGVSTKTELSSRAAVQGLIATFEADLAEIDRSVSRAMDSDRTGSVRRAVDPAYNDFQNQGRRLLGKLMALGERLESGGPEGPNEAVDLQRDLVGAAASINTLWRAGSGALELMLQMRIDRLAGVMNRAAGISVGATALCMVLIVLFSRILLYNIQELERSIDHFAASDFSAPIVKVGQQTEFAAIARAVDRLRGAVIDKLNAEHASEREMAIAAQRRAFVSDIADESAPASNASWSTSTPPVRSFSRSWPSSPPTPRTRSSAWDRPPRASTTRRPASSASPRRSRSSHRARVRSPPSPPPRRWWPIARSGARKRSMTASSPWTVRSVTSATSAA